jgi:predicted DCC family thiol-disulfide oxidoreductase YuxK
MDPAQQAVVLFDDHCNFCRSQIDTLRRLDGRNRLAFLSLHDPEIRVRYPDLSYEALMEQMWIVTPTGQRVAGAYAIRYLTRILPILWPLAPLMHIPGLMGLWQFLYRQIAKRRYLLAGKNCGDAGACSLHSSHASPTNRSSTP